MSGFEMASTLFNSTVVNATVFNGAASGGSVLGSAPVLALENPQADFSQDTIGIVIAKAVGVFVFLMVTTLILIWGERRVVARMQSRIGPNRTGPWGIFQTLADGMKLMFKEDLTPRAVDKLVYLAAPLISGVCCFMTFAVIPFGPAAQIPFTDITTPLQLTDFSVAVLYILALAAVGVYGIVLAGWSSGSPYPLLGGLRSSAQIISYEIAMGLSLISVYLYAGSMSTSTIVAAQAGNESMAPSWFAISLLPAFLIYLISMFGETNRAPFDLPEAEGELVGGFNTEYSSMKFAMFFLSEYINMITVSAVAVTLFLGGWMAPWPLSSINDGMLNQGWWPVAWFIIKLIGVLFLFIWVRASLPRFRYDQFMHLGWKVLMPLSLLWVSAIMLMRSLNVHPATNTQRIWVFVGVAIVFFIAVLGVSSWMLRGIKADARRATPPPTQVDPFAGGHPVPALPGQRLIEPHPRVLSQPSGPHQSVAKKIGSREPGEQEPDTPEPGKREPGDTGSGGREPASRGTEAASTNNSPQSKGTR